MHPPSASGRKQGEERMGLFQWLFLFSLSLTAAASDDWCYQSQECQNPGCKAPRNWVEINEECGGTNQSPINIVTSKVENNWNLKPFEYTNYHIRQQSNWNVTNTGHSVQVDLDGSAKISSGDLPGLYKAVQFHFHWGRWNNVSKEMDPGSEHSINGERYAMELHIVHIKDEYDLSEAAQKKGLAVLGFFIAIGEKNKNYDTFISKLADIPSHGNKTEMAPLPLFSLIPEEEALKNYYRYTGSLTTPNCNEGVVWTLFQEPIQLSSEQVQTFVQKIYFDKTKNLPMEDNFRPVQPVGSRIVYKSDSDALVPPAKTLVLLPVAAYLLFSSIQ
ncbi:carbonic anhydrase 4 [Eublepharis macularius]|uniref:Carbonic anhydrase n=1 Tax=Eublepharis macularius TaxID=481883 RepID=A0AA97LJ86_EUBMA|nr:carbonic anhydrase 4 [Eublepharis macularius]